MKDCFPSKDQFLELSKNYNYIPVYTELDSNGETPVSIYRKIVKNPYSFLLESVEGDESVARYSFIGIKPKEIIKTGSKEKNGEVDPLDLLENAMENIKFAPLKELPKFHGGSVGFLSYETVTYIESSVEKNAQSLTYTPESVFMIGSSLVIFDHVKQSIIIVGHADLRNSKDLEDTYRKTLESISEIITDLKKDVFSEKFHDDSNIEDSFVVHITEKERYQKMVQKTKELINQGEMIQAVLSLKLTKKVKISAINIFQSLRIINPSPYMFLLDLDDFHIIGSSPELLVQVVDGVVAAHPIAGTRARGNNEKEDKELEKELLNDEKELAEHLMLLDLGRNDVGKVSSPGSVKVTQQMEIERYSHVMHIVSHVIGDLSENFNLFDVLKSAFPAGTVSGAPKVRAMQLISEEEQYQRGPYSGAVGYFSFNGNMDTAIAIRTIILKDGIAYLQAGAGIVSDSVPEREYQECLDKMDALIKAIEHAEENY
jgi:anthranilate synthase component 1